MADDAKTTIAATSETTTTTTGAIPLQDSTFLGISVRAWLVFMLAGTICSSHLSVCVAVLIDAIMRGDWSKVGTYTNIGEPLYSMGVAALGFYFGQKTNKP